ncbi:MAG: hypothetical protein AB8B71_04740 [Paracoccaceae bacterium]
MEFEPISTTRMIALMLAGALFACAGLYMMLRPKPEGAAKVELFGLKFESSSAGLLVFLVGAAFLTVTLFVPERQTDTRQPEQAPVAKTAPVKNTDKAVLAPEIPASPSNLSDEVIVKENEPNDQIRDAQILKVGQIAAGKFKNQARDTDWYQVSFPNGDIEQHEIKLRHVNGNQVWIRVFDTREQEVGKLTAKSGASYFALKELSTNQIFIKTTGAIGGWDSDTYEISVQRK